MSFTQRTVTHQFKNGDGTAASGSVNFTLGGRMTNDGATILPTEVPTQLDAAGSISVSLYANNDTDTVPAGVQWQVELKILGLPPETWGITVPTGSGDIDLGALLPQAEQVA